MISPSSVVEFHCVGDQEQELATYHPQRLPAALTALNSVVTHLSIRIVKGKPRYLETHAMLPFIRPRLEGIPLEANHRFWDCNTDCVTTGTLLPAERRDWEPIA